MTTIQDHIANGLGFVAVLAALALFAAVLGALADLILRQDLREKMGLTALPPSLFAVAAALYVLIAFTLVVGLFLLILATIGVPITERGNSPKELADAFLFYVLRIAGLTTVLGAVIALPFTLIRLKLTQQQTKTNEESLFNEKINAATELLYARRLHTERDDEGEPTKDVWQDDITRRNAAIDRLERLANERPDFAPDIAKMLSIYVRELTAENPAEDPLDNSTPEELRTWARNLERKRTDMENAVQTLGRMIRDHDLRDQRIDLRNTNLQTFDLRGLCFNNARLDGAQLQRAILSETELQGANLEWAGLQGTTHAQLHAQGANLRGARFHGARFLAPRLNGADLSWSSLETALLIKPQLQGANLLESNLRGARLIEAQLQGARLTAARVEGVHFDQAQFDRTTFLDGTFFWGAAARNTDLGDLSQFADHMSDIFADASVIPPGGARPGDETWPEHWAKEKLSDTEFRRAWRDWQRSIGFDPKDPATWDKPEP